VRLDKPKQPQTLHPINVGSCGSLLTLNTRGSRKYL